MDRAVTLVLARRWTTVTWFFALNQSVTLLCVILECTTYTPKSCLLLTYISTAFTLVQAFIIAAFCSLRVYALCKLWLSVVVMLLCLVPVGITVFEAAVTKVQAYSDRNLCDATIILPAWLSLRLSWASRIVGVTCHGLVLLVTLYHTWATYRDARRARIKVPLAGLLIRDGTLYFMYFVAVHVSKILTDLLKLSLPKKSLVATISSVLLSPGVPIFISRFILNLRQVAHETNSITSRDFPQSTRGVQFAPNDSDMSQTLDAGFDGDTKDDRMTPWRDEARSDVEAVELRVLNKQPDR